ncbi:hypothetical protein ACFQE1_05920 [Halobium palmae]|uniref:Uncharacterized protein n=1 Tax=Halobium palmae TaxID=1776492 RepID=A0ABD5RXC1_9EURY
MAKIKYESPNGEVDTEVPADEIVIDDRFVGFPDGETYWRIPVSKVYSIHYSTEETEFGDEGEKTPISFEDDR